MKSRVAVVRCETYETEKVYKAVKKGFELLGGIESFVSTGEKILIKPNLLVGRSPEKHATTHPSVFEGVVRVLTEKGYNVSYGDSPGFGRPEKAAELCRLKPVADKYQIPFLEFDKGKSVDYPDGHQCKKFDIAQGVLDSDAIISLPKMKAHQLTRITGAVKNQFGCVYGLNKTGFHFPMPLIFQKCWWTSTCS